MWCMGLCIVGIHTSFDFNAYTRLLGVGYELQSKSHRLIVSFRSCVRAVLVKSFQSENVDGAPMYLLFILPEGRILYLV